MDTCARCEQHVSALLDGEATADEILFVIDHVPACATCQGFLAAARRLQGAVAVLRATGAAPAEAPARPAARVVRLRAATSRWVPALAAGIVFVLGLWAGGALPRRSAPQTALTEASVVEFARVLLDAEPRYRASMLALLQQVQSDAGFSDAEERADEETPAPLRGTSLDFASNDVPAGHLPR